MNKQIKTEIGVPRTRLENLTNVKYILEKVRWPDNITALESEESPAQRKNESSSGRRLKILIPSQMLSRLPISLARLKAGNNSEELKNEIRQLLYSLYRSKKLTILLYQSLVDII